MSELFRYVEDVHRDLQSGIDPKLGDTSRWRVDEDPARILSDSAFRPLTLKEIATLSAHLDLRSPDPKVRQAGRQSIVQMEAQNAADDLAKRRDASISPAGSVQIILPDNGRRLIVDDESKM